MSVDLGSAVGRILLNTKGFTDGLNTASKSLNSFQQKTSTITNHINGIGKSITNVGSSMTKKVTLPIVGVGTAIVKTTATFESKMSKVSALSGATGKDLTMLSNRAKEMGAKTKFSASEAADAMGYMALAGWDAKQMYAALPGVMNLAAASGEDLANVSDILTDNISAFGLSAKDSNEFADVLAATMSKSNTTVGMLGESFKYCASAAGALGYDYKDVALALGIMADSGIKGSQAGTTLRAVMTRLSTDAGATSKQLGALGVLTEKLGVQFYNADGSTRDLSDVLEDCRGKWKNLTAEEQANYAKKIAGQTALSGFLSLMNTEDDTWNKLKQSINGASEAYDGQGMAAGQAQTMIDNLSGQVTILKSTLESLAISLGELMLPYVKDFVAKIQDLVAKFNSLDDTQKMTIIKFAALAAAIGPVLLIFGKITTAVGSFMNIMSGFAGVGSKVASSITSLTTYFTNMKEATALAKAGFTGFAAEAQASAAAASPLGAALGSISLPVVGVVAAIGTLVAAFATLWKTNENFRNNVTGIWEGIKQKFNDFCQGIVDRLNALGFNFKDIVDVIKSIWLGFCNLLAPIFEAAFNQISNIFGTILNVITGLLDVFIGLFTGNWSQLWNGIKEIFGAIWDGIKGTFTNVLSALQGIFETVLGFFGTTWSECWNNIKNFFVNIGSSIVSAVSSFVNNVIKFFSQLPGNIAKVVSNVISSITKFASDMGKKAIEAGKSFLNGVVNFVNKLPERMGYFIGLIIGKVIKFTLDMTTKAKQAGKNFLNGVINFIKNLPSNIATWFNNTINKAQTFVTNMVSKAKQAGQKFVTNVINFIKNLPSKVATWFTNTINKAGSFVTNMATKAKSAGQKFVTNVVSFVKNLPSKVATFLTNTISKVSSFVTNMGSKAKQAANNFKNNIVNGVKSIPSKMASVGNNIVQGLWNGINGMKNWVIDKVKGFGEGLLDGIKAALGIHSPSKRAKKEVGEMFGEGVIQGVKAKKKNAKKSASELGQIILDAAKEKLDRLQTFNKISKDQEVDYWRTILKSCKKGSKAYLEAYKNLQQAKKDARAQDLSDAEAYWDKYTTYHNVSKEQEADYWKGVMSKFKKGTDEYLQAYKNYKSAKQAIQSEDLSNAEAYWDKYTTYHEESLADEVVYWDSIRQTFKEGTEERLAADKKYLSAKQALQDKEKELTEQYKDDIAKVYSDLNDKIAELNKGYEDAVNDRKNAILNVFNLFDAYEKKESVTKETLQNNLQSQVDAITDYNSNLQALASRGIVPDELFQEIANMGVDATQNIAAMNTMTDEELKQYVELWKSKTKLATEEAQKELEPMKDNVEKSIQDAKAAAQKELENLKITYEKQLNNIYTVSSTISNKTGVSISTSMASGINSASSSVQQSMSSLVGIVRDGVNTINSLVSSAKSAVNSVSTMTTKAGTLVNGSHKNGLNRVPYDGYIAELHEGERVLTKEEADAQDNGHGDTFIFNSPKAIDEKEAARQMKKVKQQLSLSY